MSRTYRDTHENDGSNSRTIVDAVACHVEDEIFCILPSFCSRFASYIELCAGDNLILNLRAQLSEVGIKTDLVCLPLCLCYLLFRYFSAGILGLPVQNPAGLVFQPARRYLQFGYLPIKAEAFLR
jgi:hypothetical protein